MNMIVSNPADKVQRPKVEQFIGSFYNENELNTLFEKSKGDPLELIIFLTAFYGLRRSEIAGLKWNAINFENNSITIKHTIVQVSIKGERQVLGKDRTKNKTSYRTLLLVPEVAEILKRFKQIQEWLGHSNFNTTANIYAHLYTNVKQKSADVLSNILKSQKNISNCEELDIEIG